MAGIDKYTKLLLHLDGVDNGTTFTDSSDSNHTIIRNTTVTKTNTSKFGGSSAYFNGTNSYLNFGASADYSFGSSPFALDFWVYRSRSNTQEAMLNSWADYNATDNWHIYISAANKLSCFPKGYQGGAGPSLTGATSITQDAWHHIAATFDGTTYRMFLDGTLDSSAVLIPGSNSDQPLAIGISSVDFGGQPFQGYIDEIRISKGVVRWVTNFTPPISEYSRLIYSISGNIKSPCVINIIQGDTVIGSKTVSVGDYEAIFSGADESQVIVYAVSNDETRSASKITPITSSGTINVTTPSVSSDTPQVPLEISGIMNNSSSCTVSIIESNRMVKQKQIFSGPYSILYNGLANDTTVNIIAESPDLDKNCIVYRNVKPLLSCPSDIYPMVVSNKPEIDVFNFMVRDEAKSIFVGNNSELYLSSQPNVDILNFMVRDEVKSLFQGNIESLVLSNKPNTDVIAFMVRDEAKSVFVGSIEELILAELPEVDVLNFMVRDEAKSVFVGNSSSLVLQEDREVLSCVALTT